METPKWQSIVIEMKKNIFVLDYFLMSSSDFQYWKRGSWNEQS